MHTLIFDIGKTNKKAFVFDKKYKELHKSYVQFEEKQDEDGFPCDDLDAIQLWIQKTLTALLQDPNFDITAINFSSYGASLVHLDATGKPLTPLYNYLKPYPPEVLTSFYATFGKPSDMARETASPRLAMLNSGLQLYWLKKTQPEIFKAVRWSLHLPQYLSYLLTGVPLSEYTSIGCHTTLWDFENQAYHDWVRMEKLDHILAPLVPTNTSINRKILGKQLKVGIGIHDSSAALLPYLMAEPNPFLLLSTGTWSIALNPFNQELLTEAELAQDCLNFLRVDGNPVKAARLFLGEEYKTQLRQLIQYYTPAPHAHRQVEFDPRLYAKISERPGYLYRFKHLNTSWQQPPETQFSGMATFEEAFHQLMWELVQLQIRKAELAIGSGTVNKIFIDGGFADNKVYVAMLAHHFTKAKIRTTASPLGSALGAAMVVRDKTVGKKFLKRNYALKKYKRQVVSQDD
ncbi:MAG: carbohydrate kinase [Saprospiraceae bacterium]|nr:carbohydrate kinase [Saprospiraceae bacterium]